MTDTGSEYGRLLAERDRLIAEGVDPAELEMPLRPRGPAMTTETEPRTEAGRALSDGHEHVTDSDGSIAQVPVQEQRLREALLLALQAEVPGSCDWGDCDNNALLARFDPEIGWLPVCQWHVGDASAADLAPITAIAFAELWEGRALRVQVEGGRAMTDERQAGLLEALATELVPWFKVRGDDSLDQGIMRRCLLCGRTSRIVSSTASPSAVDHEADCAFEAAATAVLAIVPAQEERLRAAVKRWSAARTEWMDAPSERSRVALVKAGDVLALLSTKEDGS